MVNHQVPASEEDEPSAPVPVPHLCTSGAGFGVKTRGVKAMAVNRPAPALPARRFSPALRSTTKNSVNRSAPALPARRSARRGCCRETTRAAQQGDGLGGDRPEIARDCPRLGAPQHGDCALARRRQGHAREALQGDGARGRLPAGLGPLPPHHRQSMCVCVCVWREREREGGRGGGRHGPGQGAPCSMGCFRLRSPALDWASSPT